MGVGSFIITCRALGDTPAVAARGTFEEGLLQDEVVDVEPAGEAGVVVREADIAGLLQGQQLLHLHHRLQGSGCRLGQGQGQGHVEGKVQGPGQGQMQKQKREQGTEQGKGNGQEQGHGQRQCSTNTVVIHSLSDSSLTLFLPIFKT